MPYVAPFTGAWIEISLRRTATCWRWVAPFTGAWIEMPSPAVRAVMHEVAPFTGAWIEIAGRGRLDWPLSSLPSRERGLKFQSFRLLVPLLVSLPSRERGLK